MSILSKLRSFRKVDAPHSANATPNTAPAPSPSELADEVQALFQDALASHQNGQLTQAQLIYEKILAIQPDHADALHCLGVIAMQSNLPQRAVEFIGKAIASNPTNFGFHMNHGNAMRQLRQLESAIASFDQAIALKPDFAAAYFNRGVSQQELHQPSAAVASYDAVISLQPNHAEAYANRGVAQHALMQIQAAVASYDKAIALHPSYAQAFMNRGLALHEQQQLSAALASYDQAIALEPAYADAYCSRGRVLNDLKQHEAAVASYDHAIALHPGYADAYYNRGIALGLMRQVGRAEDSYRRALEIDPTLAEAHHNLALSLLTGGNIRAAAQGFRDALAIDPHLNDAHSGLLLCLSSEAHVDAATLFTEHVRFGTQFETPLRPLWQAHANTIDQGRKLNIGFVSGDLYNHAVATFIEPVLQELSQSPALCLHAYYNHTVHDHVNGRLQGYFDHWNEVATLSHAGLAEKIRADSIDILIDLSGHTGLNRLVTFAHKPAPIQASWIGFPGTTGLQAMDYYLTDRFFLPPSEFASQFTEKLVCLPASAPFLPSKEAPDVNALPALTNGYLTFGSFNKLKKFSPEVVALWAQVLRAQPNSRMLLGGMESAENPTVVEWFANDGVSAERLRFHPVSDMNTYLSLHHQVDICLDTFPYNGGTTSLHALWMGVPTLSLSGSTPVSRCGACISGHMGFDFFQASSSQEFVEHSLKWAGQLEELAEIRAHMRERFSATPMGRPPAIAAGLEQAFRTMWMRWCSQLPPETFEVT